MVNCCLGHILEPLSTHHKPKKYQLEPIRTTENNKEPNRTLENNKESQRTKRNLSEPKQNPIKTHQNYMNPDFPLWKYKGARLIIVGPKK